MCGFYNNFSLKKNISNNNNNKKMKRPDEKTRPAESGRLQSQKAKGIRKKKKTTNRFCVLRGLKKKKKTNREELHHCSSCLLKHFLHSINLHNPYNVDICKVHFSICLVVRVSLFHPRVPPLQSQEKARGGSSSSTQHGVYPRVPTSSSSKKK